MYFNVGAILIHPEEPVEGNRGDLIPPMEGGTKGAGLLHGSAHLLVKELGAQHIENIIL